MKYSKELTALCAVVFISLCFLHYLSPRPFDHDENIIVENIMSREYSGLFQALSGMQIHPRVHLSLMKFISQSFEYKTQAVRFLPLMFMLMSFILWIKLFEKNLEDKFLRFLAVLGFSCSYHLIYYSAEAKPYSADVFVVAVYLLFFLHQKKSVSKKPGIASYFGAALLPLLMFFSYASIFVVWIISFNYLLSLRENKGIMPLFVLNVFMTVLCAAVFYSVDLQYGFKNTQAYNYWNSYFLCHESFYCFLKPWWEGTRKIVAWWFRSHTFMIKAGSAFIPFFLYAIVKYGGGFLKKDGWRVFSAEALGLILYLELIVFGLMEKYPFIGTRLTLFLAPFVILLIIRGIDDLKRFRKVHLAVLSYFIVFLVIGAISAFFKFLNFYKVL